MAALALDTHQFVKDLTAGFSETQAEAVTSVVRRTRDIDISNLATKTDLAELKSEVLKWYIGVTGFQFLGMIAAVIPLNRTLG